MAQKAVVTGGAGFIGSHIVEALLAKGYEVSVVDNFVGGRRDDRLFTEATLFEEDIRNTEGLTAAFAGARYVFHLAALPRVQDSIDHPKDTFDVNVTGTLSVLEAARAAGVEKVVFASSAAVYGDQDVMPLEESMRPTPKSPYGLHKQMGEEMLALWASLYGLKSVALRYFNVYGPRFDPNGAYALVVGKFIHLRSQGKALTIAGDGNNTRDYVHVRDIARANLMAAESGSLGDGEVINIGSGIETSVNDLAAIIGGPTEAASARIEPTRSFALTDRARTLLAWAPEVQLADGINELKQLHGIA